MWSAINDISINNCPFHSFVNVLCASSDESIDTASWSASFMADGSKPIPKNRLHYDLEALWNFDCLLKLIATSIGSFQGDLELISTLSLLVAEGGLRS